VPGHKRRWVERGLTKLRSGLRFPQPDFGGVYWFERDFRPGVCRTQFVAMRTVKGISLKTSAEVAHPLFIASGRHHCGHINILPLDFAQGKGAAGALRSGPGSPFMDLLSFDRGHRLQSQPSTNQDTRQGYSWPVDFRYLQRFSSAHAVANRTIGMVLVTASGGRSSSRAESKSPEHALAPHSKLKIFFHRS
jgi:hypothetical protein